MCSEQITLSREQLLSWVVGSRLVSMPFLKGPRAQRGVCALQRLGFSRLKELFRLFLQPFTSFLLEGVKITFRIEWNKIIYPG